jgi:hypothetical protein
MGLFRALLVILFGVSLALSFGRAALAHWLAPRLRRSMDDLASPRFHTFSWEQLPGWVRAKLGPLRAAFVDLGFRELVNYQRESERINYTSVLVSDDGSLTVHIWVAHFRGLRRWLTLLHSWRFFLRDMLALPRFALVTYYEGGRSFHSSPVELKTNHVPGETEFVTLPPDIRPSDALRLHDPGAREFGRRVATAPVALKTAAQFLENEREFCIRVAERIRIRRAARGLT